MPTTLDQVTEEAMQLTADDRATLAERMHDSLETDEDKRIQNLWVREAVRRVEEVRSGKVKPIPLEEAVAEVRRSIGL